MTHLVNGIEVKAAEITFDWIEKQVCARNSLTKEKIALMDGQPSIWGQQRKHFIDKSMLKY